MASSLMNVRLSILRYIHAFLIPDSSLHARQKWILGLINLATVVIFWVLSSFLVNAMVEDDEYRKPFFITWTNTSCFSLYIIPYLRLKNMSLKQFMTKMRRGWRYSRVSDKQGGAKAGTGAGTGEESISGSVRSSSPYGSDDNENNNISTMNVIEDEENDVESNLISVKSRPSTLDGTYSEAFANEDSTEDGILDVGIFETFQLSLLFIILWFTANLVTNASLSYTSVASQTILSSTSSFFTLIIGFLKSVEKVSQSKVLGILLSFAGVLIVTKADTTATSSNPIDTNPNADPNKSTLVIIWGNLLALAGALIYGIYTILLKQKITIPNSHKERNLNTHLFFGFVGLICFLGLWPILIILHFTGVEEFELPPTLLMTELLIINAGITFISDFCWCNAVLLTSPLTVTVGLSMTIPLAMIGDWVFKGFQLNLVYIFGAVIVTTGFLIINKEEEDDFVIDEL